MRLLGLIRQVRSQGWALVDQELEDGVRSVRGTVARSVRSRDRRDQCVDPRRPSQPRGAQGPDPASAARECRRDKREARQAVTPAGDGILAMLLRLFAALRDGGVDVSLGEVLDAASAMRHVDLLDRDGCAPRCRRRWSSGPRTSRSSRRCSTSASHSVVVVTLSPQMVVFATRLSPARPPPGVGIADTDLSAELLRALRDADIDTLRLLVVDAVDRYAGMDTTTGGERYFLHRVLRALDLANLLVAAMVEARGLRATAIRPSCARCGTTSLAASSSTVACSRRRCGDGCATSPTASRAPGWSRPAGSRTWTCSRHRRPSFVRCARPCGPSPGSSRAVRSQQRRRHQRGPRRHAPHDPALTRRWRCADGRRPAPSSSRQARRRRALRHLRIGRRVRAFHSAAPPRAGRVSSRGCAASCSSTAWRR